MCCGHACRGLVHVAVHTFETHEHRQMPRRDNSRVCVVCADVRFVDVCVKSTTPHYYMRQAHHPASHCPCHAAALRHLGRSRPPLLCCSTWAVSPVVHCGIFCFCVLFLLSVFVLLRSVQRGSHDVSGRGRFTSPIRYHVQVLDCAQVRRHVRDLCRMRS